jgi:hypothetical protein
MFLVPGRKTHRTSCALIALVCLLALSGAAAFAQSSQQPVKFSLKADASDSTAIDVNLNFSMRIGAKAVIKPSKQTNQSVTSGPPPALELLPVTNPPYSVEVLQGPDSGWTLTATSDATVNFPYKVRFTPAGSSSGSGTPATPVGVAPPRGIASATLKAFQASDALLVPQNPTGGYAPGPYGVEVQVAQGEKVLSPWQKSGSSYKVGTLQELFSNYLAWGKITLSNLQSKGPVITAGFSDAYGKVSDNQKSTYGDDLMKIEGEISRLMGARTDQSAVTVLVTGAGEYGLDQPAAETMRDSWMLFHGGSQLTGEASAAAARGWLGLWNGWSLVASAKGQGQWLEMGLPWFYSYRIAGRLGLMDSNAAYQGFARVYADYLADPQSGTISLASASTQPAELLLLQRKGAALCAAMSVKLAQEVSKDFEWFLGQMAKQFNGFEGKDYSQVDISEVLEKGTGNSWDRFFAGRFDGKDVILASEFSTTDQFGSGGVVGGKKLAGKGSSKNWIYLIVGVLVVFSIPIIFSSYIRRAVKLDVSMPKLLPDWDEDGDVDEGATPAPPKPVIPNEAVTVVEHSIEEVPVEEKAPEPAEAPGEDGVSDKPETPEGQD